MKRLLLFILGTGLCLGIVATAKGAPTTVGQPFILHEKLLGSQPESSAEFGTALALSRDGQVMVVGTPLKNVNGNSNQGQATVFRRQSDDTWDEVQVLRAPDGQADDLFGTAVAIANTPDYTIVVGAPNYDQGGDTNIGAAYTFAYNSTNWDAGVKLPISDANEEFNDYRGTAVAISADGSTVFVGATGLSVGAFTPGAVYVLTRPNQTYIQIQILTGPTGGQAGMGSRLLINDDNNLLFASGVYAPSGPIITWGAVHVYTKPSTSWVYDERIVASDGVEFDDFGISMDISDDEQYLFIGAPHQSVGGSKVYVFRPSGGSWNEETILPRPTEFIYSHFGASVSVDSAAETAVIGAWLNGSGGIHVYERSGNSWQRQQTLTTSDDRQEHLGYSVAISKNADMVVSGARSAHSGPDYDPVGAVYTYVPGYQAFIPMITR